MKRVLAIVLCFVLILSVFAAVPFTASAAETDVAAVAQSGVTGSCTWELNGTVLTISGNGKMGDYNVESAPWGKDITKAVFKSGVKNIGAKALAFCTKLASVEIADTVTQIGWLTFSGCNALESVTIPDSVTSIEAWAFNECTSLSTIVIPDSVKHIENGAFFNTAWLNNKPDGLVYAGKVAYKVKGACPATVNIKDGTVSIVEFAFADCSELNTVKIPDSVAEIGELAFQNCTGLKSVVIPASVTCISEYLFSYCTGLTDVTIPGSVKEIGEHAFDGCTSLSDLTVPGSVKRIGAYAFEDTAWFDSQPDGLVYAGKVAYQMKGTCPAAVKIKAGTVAIAGSAFSYCTKMTSISIPNSVKIIDEDALFLCSGLKSITIPDSVKSIYIGAFFGCESLTAVTVPAGITVINDSLFYNCSSLKSVKLLGKVKSIGERAFKNCENLTSFDIPDTVTEIGTEAFSECQKLKSIIIPASVKKIGWEAFGYYGISEYSDGSKVGGFTVYGYKGTAAQKYATDNGFTFVALLTKPKLGKVQNAAAGVSVAWGKSTGAAKYRVFRKTASGNWAKIADTTALSYVDKTVKSGTKYTYTVRCISKDGKSYTSEYDNTGKSILYLAQPKITERGNVAKGIKLTWSKSTGAASYKVYLKNSSSWKLLATVKTNTYTYTKVKSGTTYTYTVRAVSKDGKTLSAYNTTGWSQKFIAAPAVPTLKNTKSGVQVTFKKVAGAARYRVFRKLGSGKWTKLADTTKLTLVDKTAKNGKIYYYTVRCISKDGKAYTSAYSAKGAAIKCKR